MHVHRVPTEAGRCPDKLIRNSNSASSTPPAGLWSRGGEKALTMRGVAKAAGTTTPTLYERYHDRDDILRAVRIQTRVELFAALRRTRSLTQACERYLEFALEHPHAYEMLFDGFAQPPSLHEPWPSFNLMRLRLAQRLGGTPRKHTRLMLSVWSLMHGTAMLMIRGGACRSAAHPNDSLLPGCRRSDHCRGRPLEGQDIFGPEVAREPDPRRSRPQQGNQR